MSDENSAYPALIRNISDRDRGKDVEQFDDILRTFVNETIKFEGCVLGELKVAGLTSFTV